MYDWNIEEPWAALIERQKKRQETYFMYNIQKGSVPAIPHTPNAYLKPILSKRRIKAKTFSNFYSKNIVKRHQLLNEKCFLLPTSKTYTYRYFKSN